MASIFTFDPDPPRVSSPWSNRMAGRVNAPVPSASTVAGTSIGKTDRVGPDKCEVTNLGAEPQDGPTEYKLHLLLRPRRSFSSTTTATSVAGSQHPRPLSNTLRSVSEQHLGTSPGLSQSSTSRQHRFEQLTTQLLWRLQQSAPVHSSAKGTLNPPSLPDISSDLELPKRLEKLLPGLEESQGALYEIGVADDGSFIGLAEDEMNESLRNLQVMAASLGCLVEVLRMVPVGDCAWCEKLPEISTGLVERQGKLYVAEAYVKPDLRQSQTSENSEDDQLKLAVPTASPAKQNLDAGHSSTSTADQLRVSLTGATTSGKSTLLGTLSTSTLDNGKGKSRLSLLKHRHEVASGVTSSVAQELVGYRHLPAYSGTGTRTEVVNYANDDVTTWNDIHAFSLGGRLAFLSDSAGHPRYRRTTVRGLLGWAPHWTILCISAADGLGSSSYHADQEIELKEIAGSGKNANLSVAHLDLCLRLQLPLIIVFTKLDIAVKARLRQTLSELLSALKAAHRKPILLANDTGDVTNVNLQIIPLKDASEAQRVNLEPGSDGLEAVPIIFTSAVNGTGIGKLHALLSSLPIRKPMDLIWGGESWATSRSPMSAVFHVDDVYNFPVEPAPSFESPTDTLGKGYVVSGHLAAGRISIGDEMKLGPFSESSGSSQAEPGALLPSEADDQFLLPRSFTDALAQTTASPKSPTLRPREEWQRMKVVSIRNLRLPVQQLKANYVGTLGIVLLDSPLPSSMPVRRGMVLTNGNPRAFHTVTASFQLKDASSVSVGSRAVFYSASVRAPAKVVAVALSADRQDSNTRDQPFKKPDDDFEFNLGEDEDEGAYGLGCENVRITLQMTAHREWLQVGAHILVMPGGGSERGFRGQGELEGFVGKIEELFG